MTNSEVKKKIAEAKNADWYENVEETFNFTYVDFVLPITGVSAIHEFLTQQIKGWEKIGQPLPNELLASKTYFENIRKEVVNFIINYTPSENGNLQHYWSNIRNIIKNTNSYPIPYNSPQAEFLIKIYKESPKYFQGAFNFLVSANFNVNNKELFFGAILAYEFSIKDKTEITGRKKAEQKSISKLKNDFQNYLSESESQLVEYLKEANNKYEEYATQIDDLKTEKENLFTEWFDNTKNKEWQTWYEEKTDKLQKLEDTYEAKLKLEKPAKYWQMKSTKYYEQGTQAKTILLWIIGITAVFLALILIISPNWIFANVFNGNSTAIVRWSIVFITLLSRP